MVKFVPVYHQELISVGALDAHVGAIGAGLKPGKFVKIIGTSTCDIMVFPKSESFMDFEGVSGIVNDSVSKKIILELRLVKQQLVI